ncbi:MAG: hypothetical protein ACXABK_05350, partial [Candidatus Heimdallarchaeaceae archaeon]
MVTAGYERLEYNTIHSNSYFPKYQLTSEHDYGSSQPAHFTWQISKDFQNLNNHTGIEISNEEGLLCKQTLNITDITPEPLILAVEDYDPSLAPEFDYIYADESSFMGFHINGTQQVQINGFWIYLRGESRGILRYQIYSAILYNSHTFPNITDPLTSTTDVAITPTIEDGEERWIWLNLEETLIVDPTSTYNNTFYLGLWRAFDDSTRIRWVYCHDTGFPDRDDEGDCYGRFASFVYRARDLYLNVSISPIVEYPYPSDINLKANNEAVTNQSVAGKGWWDSGKITPAVDTSTNSQIFNITYLWSDFYQWYVTYDVIWTGCFFSVSSAQTEYQAWVDQTAVHWTISVVVDYPETSGEQVMNISIEEDWTVITVRKNTILHSNWTEFESHLMIQSAGDGLWSIECSAPNYIFNIDLKNSKNESITETFNDDVLRIFCSVKDPKGEKISNGYCNLIVYDPDNLLNYQELNQSVSSDSNTNIEFLWDLSLSVQQTGIYTINLAWKNGTAVGLTNAYIHIKIPLSSIAKVQPYIILFSVLIITIIGSYLILRYFVLLPRKREKMKVLLEQSEIFENATKLNRLLIIHKKSGLCFYDPMSKESIDANLMGGLLQALSTFGGSLVGGQTQSFETVDVSLQRVS